MIAVNQLSVLNAVHTLDYIPGANFDECVKLRNPRWANCKIPDVGFSLNLPKSAVLRNMRIGFVGDSVLKQIYDAFECMYPETESNYFESGITGNTLCNFCVSNSDQIVSYKFDILILSEGLWFNLHPRVGKMVWRDYLTEIPCVLSQLRELNVKFLWIQRTFQHFNTRGGDFPHLRTASPKTKKEQKKYAKCVPLSSIQTQSAYHFVLERNFRIFFPNSTGLQMVLEDFTQKMHMMHTGDRKKGLLDCTHYCQKKNGVPFQFAKNIAEHILLSKDFK